MYLVWEGRCTRSLVGKSKAKGPLVKDLGLDGRIILKLIFKEWVGDLDWIDLGQDLHERQTPVNTVTNLRVP
jgi:hypothetical protein